MGRSRKRKNNKRIVLNVILSVILVLSIIIMILQNSTGADFLAKSPYALLKIMGGSMEPELHDGDAVLVKNDRFEDLKTGYTIVFVKGEELITHKIVTTGDDYVITRGTANTDDDEPVVSGDYKARVVCRIPLLGNIWRLYSNPLLFSIWVMILVLLIFGDEIFPRIYDLIQAAKSRRK